MRQTCNSQDASPMMSGEHVCVSEQPLEKTKIIAGSKRKSVTGANDVRWASMAMSAVIWRPEKGRIWIWQKLTVLRKKSWIELLIRMSLLERIANVDKRHSHSLGIWRPRHRRYNLNGLSFNLPRMIWRGAQNIKRLSGKKPEKHCKDQMNELSGRGDKQSAVLLPWAANYRKTLSLQQAKPRTTRWKVFKIRRSP